MKAADGLLKETEIEYLSFHIMYTNKMEQGHSQENRQRTDARKGTCLVVWRKPRLLRSSGTRHHHRLAGPLATAATAAYYATDSPSSFLLAAAPTSPFAASFG